MSINVLLVAKERVHRKILTNLLDQLDYAGFVCVEADSGKEAINQIRTKPPIDILMIDVRLEDVSAAQFLNGLRSIDVYQNTAVIILCDDGDPNLREIRNHKIQAILSRPFDGASSKKILARVAYGVALRAGLRRETARRLLIVDDDLSFLKQCEALLGVAFKVLTAPNMDRGVSQAILDPQIDVILLSTKLAGGWEEVLRLLREQLRLPPQKIFLLDVPAERSGSEALADGIIERNGRFESFVGALVKKLFAAGEKQLQVLLAVVKTDMLVAFRDAALERVESYSTGALSFSYRRNQTLANDWQAVMWFESSEQKLRLALSLTGMYDELSSMVHAVKGLNVIEGEVLEFAEWRKYLFKLLEPLGAVVLEYLQRWDVHLHATQIECNNSLSNRISYDWSLPLLFESDTTSHRFMIVIGLAI